MTSAKKVLLSSFLILVSATFVGSIQAMLGRNIPITLRGDDGTTIAVDFELGETTVEDLKRIIIDRLEGETLTIHGYTPDDIDLFVEDAKTKTLIPEALNSHLYARYELDDMNRKIPYRVRSKFI